jgi:hypothetical protein
VPFDFYVVFLRLFVVQDFEILQLLQLLGSHQKLHKLLQRE